MKKIILILILVGSMMGCTAQQRAKHFGGNIEVEIEANKKLVNLTWKHDNLWILTRQRQLNEIKETYEFKESSSLGIWEGTITIIEK